MALAIRFDGLVPDGQIESYAALARLGHVTPARITQIMGLLNLAPDIIESLLHLPMVEKAAIPSSFKTSSRWRGCSTGKSNALPGSD